MCLQLIILFYKFVFILFHDFHLKWFKTTFTNAGYTKLKENVLGFGEIDVSQIRLIFHEINSILPLHGFISIDLYRY